MKNAELTLLLSILCIMKNLSIFSVTHSLLKFIVSDKKEKWDDIYYVAWLDIFAGSIKGLQYFDPESKVWGQAHILASYVIF